MGAYLSEPVIEKLSVDEEGEWLNYGASSMQGWRVSQEDAHNAILNYDKDTHLFAVYDGHGGHEVAAYTAVKLPDFLKETEGYEAGNMSEALTEAFLTFDATLVQPDVVNVLKQIAGTKDDDDEEEGAKSESETEEVDHLYREATMPLDQVMAKYADNPHLARVKKEKALSPFLRAKSTILTSKTEGPIKCDIEDDREIPSSSSSSQSCALSTEGTLKGSGHSDYKAEGKVQVNGEESHHIVNGEVVENHCEKNECSKMDSTCDEKKNKICTDADSGDVEKDKEVNINSVDSKKNEDSESGKSATAEHKGENGESIVNGSEVQETVKGKGKGGKSGKGKAVLKNSEIQAMKEAKAKEQKREAALKAVEIYRKIQEGVSEEDASDEEEEEDESFEDETEEGDGDESEGEESEDESDEENENEDNDEEEEVEDEEDEEDEDPYTEFAMNMREEPGYDSGCTACVALIQGTELYVANVGDSRCVVSRGGKAIEMSIDHKPEDDPEAARIIKAGGRVTADGRVNGGLNLSRAIGDHGYKQNKNLNPSDQMISPLPDVKSLTLEPKDKFIIVACDGIWNSLSSQEACDFVSERLAEEDKLSAICEELFDHCLAPDTHGDGTGCDNMTCIIITLKERKIKSMASLKRSSDEAGNDISQDEKKVKSDGD